MTSKKKAAPLQAPSFSDVRHNLLEPETAPAPSATLDRRTLRRKGHTQQFNVLVSPQYLKDFKLTARQHRMSYEQLYRVSLAAFQRLPEEEQERLIREVLAGEYEG